MIATERTDLIEKAHLIASKESELGYLHFLDHVVVDAQPKKKPFRIIAEDWQWWRSMRSAPALDHLAGVSQEPYLGPKSFWNGYHKGSDKTHDNAREICWLLGWSKRRLNLYVCAGGEDQAALLTAAMKGIVLDNPWIAERVQVTDLTAKGSSGSELTVLSMNAYGSQGVFPDYVVASEVTHWLHDEGRKFWDFILSSVNKRPECVLKVETNAGHKGSWQWDERNRIAGDKEKGIAPSPFWSFYEAPVGTPLPTWMNQLKIDDDSRGMAPGERDRLYKNRWVDPGEEYGYLTQEEAEACIDKNLTERITGERYQEYFAVIDYGGVTDRCSLTVMHAVAGGDSAVIDRLDCWQGDHQNRIDINVPEDDPDRRSVEGWFLAVRKNFRIAALVVDPAQLEGLAIKYERLGVRVIRFKYRGGQANYRLAQILKTSIQNRKVTWSPLAGRLPTTHMGKNVEDYTLPIELSRLIVKPMSYGYRIDHESGRHDDRAVGIGMGLLHCLPEALPPGSTGPTAVGEVGKTQPIGASPTRLQKETNDSLDRWKILGLNGNGGSAWQRGDLGERP